LRELVIIDPQKSGAARIEGGWLIDSDKVIGWQLSRGMEPNLVQHAREINQPFGLAIVAAGSSHRGKLPGLVLMCQYRLGTMRVTPLAKVGRNSVSGKKRRRRSIIAFEMIDRKSTP